MLRNTSYPSKRFLLLFIMISASNLLLSQVDSASLQLKLNNIDTLFNKSDYKKALPLYEALLEESNQFFGEIHSFNAGIYKKITQCVGETGGESKAVAIGEKAIEIASKTLGENNILSAGVLQYVGSILPYIGKTDEGLEMVKKSYKMYEAIDADDITMAKIQSTLGSTYSFVDAIDSSILLLKQADKTMTEANVDDVYHGHIKNNLGAMYQFQGKFKKSKPYFFEAVDIYEKHFGTNYLNLNYPLKNIAICLSQEGKEEEALKYYYSVLKLIEPKVEPHSETLLSVKNNIAMSIFRIGRLDESIRIMDTIIRHQKEHYSLATQHGILYLRNQAHNYIETSEYDKALANIQQVLELAPEVYPEPHYDVVRTHGIQAKIFLNQKKYKETIASATKGIKLLDECAVTFYHIYAELYMYLFAANASLKESEQYKTNKKLSYQYLGYDESKPENIDSIISIKDMFIVIKRDIDVSWDLYQKTKDRTFLNSILDKMELSKKLLAIHFDNIQNAESIHALIKSRKSIFDKSIKSSLELYRITKSKEHLKEALVLINLNRSRKLQEALKKKEVFGYFDVPRKKAIEKEEIEIELHRLNGDKEYAATNIEIDSLNSLIYETYRKKTAWHKNVSEAYPKYNSFYANDSILLYQPQSGELLIDTYEGDDFLSLFMIDHHSISVINLEKNNQFESLFKKTNLGLKEKDSKQTFKELMAFLSIPTIDQNEIKTIKIIPSGKFLKIPFEILVSDDQYWIEKFDISYHPSQQLMSHPFSKQKNNGKIGIYAADYNSIESIEDQSPIYAALVRDGSYNLPGAVLEAQKINEIFTADLYSGDDCNVATFKEKAYQNEVLHLAMHSILNPDDGMKSYLLFGDEKDTINRLYTYELYDQKLNAALAVLSACNTGMGELQYGEGALSLAHAFNYAGVPSTVSSLWKVPDQATSYIMVEFYKNLKKGFRKDESLRQAKLSYLNDDTISENLKTPYHWAGFIVSGSTDPIHIGTSFNKMLAIPILIVLFVIGYFFWNKSSKRKST